MRVRHLDCTSSTFCMGLSDTGSGVGRASSFNDSRWTAPTVIDARITPDDPTYAAKSLMESISCVADRFCVAAADSLGYIAVYQ